MGRLNPRFFVAWSGEICARLGYQISLFILPLLVATVMHGRGVQVGLTSAMQTIPVIALSVLAGAMTTSTAVVRRILILANVARAIVIGAIGVLYAAFSLPYWYLLITALVMGAASVFYDVGNQVMLPALVPARSLVSANGLIQSSTAATQMLGPAAAGFLLQILRPSFSAAVVTVLFAAATVLFGVLRVPPASGTPAARVPIGAGLSFIWHCRPIRDLCVQSGMFNLHEQAFLTTFLLFGLHVLNLSSGTVGAIIGVGSIGALAGSLAAAPLSRRLHIGRTLPIAIATASLAFLLVPTLAAYRVPTALLGAGFVANGAALTLYNVLAVSLRQSIPPSEFLGPVTAMYRLAVFGTMPVGALLGGVLTDAVGSTAALWAITISLCLCSLPLFVSPLRGIRSVVDGQSFHLESLKS